MRIQTETTETVTTTIEIDDIRSLVVAVTPEGIIIDGYEDEIISGTMGMTFDEWHDAIKHLDAAGISGRRMPWEPMVKEVDPEFERLLAEEEAIESSYGRHPASDFDEQ